MTSTDIIARQGRSTQSARRNLFAAVAAGAPAWRIEASEQALLISEQMLLASVGWDLEAALAAEVAASGMDVTA